TALPDPIAHELTFLFTDVEGSTQLLERLGPGYGIVLEKHRALITSAIESNGGHVVDCRGDEFFAAFPESRGAVAAAVDAQRRLGGETWPAGAPGRVRIAALLEAEGFDVVGQAGTGVDLLALVDEELPDIAIVDIRMPPTKTDEGIRATHEIKRRHPRTGVLLLSSYLDVKSAVELFAAQPDGIGYMLKERVADVDDFTEAVRRVATGGTVLDVAILEVLRAGEPNEQELAIL